MLQAAVEWLNEKDVVRLLLRAHLHQRQYMEQVQPLAGLLAQSAAGIAMYKDDQRACC